MELESAQHSFTRILTQLDNQQRDRFIRWITATCTTDPDEETLEQAERKLKLIAEALRETLPEHDASVPTEKLQPPAAIDAKRTVYVDAFIYDDELMEDLFQAGQISKYYCPRCESWAVKPLTIMSQSLSRDHLIYIFQSVLPDLSNKTLLDVGSRLGAVLYGCYLLTKANSIIGIEMNGRFCEVQEGIVERFEMGDRITVVNSDVMMCASLVRTADVVFLHNVFEFFWEEERQVSCWEFLRENVRKAGALIVTVPDIEGCLRKLKMEAKEFMEGWVREMAFKNVVKDCDVHLYAVL